MSGGWGWFFFGPNWVEFKLIKLYLGIYLNEIQPSFLASLHCQWGRVASWKSDKWKR